MAEVRHLFEVSEFFVPEMLIAARSMQVGMEILKPNLSTGDLGACGYDCRWHGRWRSA